MQNDAAWTEQDSAAFIEEGASFTPHREEIALAIAQLIPRAPDDAFSIVDIACGSGWLSESLLHAFPNAAVHALDGSPAMLREAAQRLQRFEGRVKLEQFDLMSADWLAKVRAPVSAFVSSLALHHLDHAGKAALYKALFDRLERPGCLLMYDIIAPAGEIGWRYAADQWDRHVRSVSEEAYSAFERLQWNYYRYPDDPIDQPSSVAQHLEWLKSAGFASADVFRLYAGHALFGGFK